MLKSRDQEPRLPPSRVLITRAQLRLTYGALVMLAATTAGFGGAYVWATTRDAQLYVVVTDREGIVYEVAQAHSGWSPDPAMWRRVAKDWLLNVRARSLDPAAWKQQMAHLAAHTDRSQWNAVDEWMVANQPTLRSAVDVEITSDTVRKSEATTAEVFLRWRERRRDRNGNLGDWVSGAITLILGKGPPQVERDLKNDFGLYVLGFDPLKAQEEEAS